MPFEILERQSITVWLYTLKQWKQLRKFGNIHYISHRMKYAVLYVNQQNLDKVIEELEKLNFVRSIELSHRKEIDMTFKDAIPNRIDPDLKEALEESEEDLEDFFKGLAQELDEKRIDKEQVN
ncbi:YlbG family protein [Facklamia sp. DSM 111018]|uniref:UPF0298 protein HZY91_06955 n=1 Tax=Facklamia lactis TaxID=2749967 RepID=A0ABS0LR34_9LACT|nr:YlbG family protein [Facklamia lactis]MBG9981005.1 YlbG family protein [Facklamia lactis]MBG9986632.1 YlbG family protein [Facklamia lactis]